MSGRAEQKRRAAAVEREVQRARNLLLRQVLELTEFEDLDVVKGFCQAELGMMKPLEQVRRELRGESIH